MEEKEKSDAVETIITCEGDLKDPEFPCKFKQILDNLCFLICQDSDRRFLRVKKVEPWNSVRVTFSLGPDAAERLRILAGQGGGEVLGRLGILSVQLRPAEVISIRVSQPAPSQSNAPTINVNSVLPAAPQPTPVVVAQPSPLPVPQENPGPSNRLHPPVPTPQQTPVQIRQSLHLPQQVIQVQQGPSRSVFTPYQNPVQVNAVQQKPLVQQNQISLPQASNVPKVAHYPPPPYPGQSRTQIQQQIQPQVVNNVVSTAAVAPPPPPQQQVVVEPQIKPVESVESPLLVNLLQTDGQPQVIGSRFQTGPQTVVHHRPQPPPPPPPPLQENHRPPIESKDSNGEELTSSGKKRQYLINPLTGVLEPMSSDSSSESEPETTESPITQPPSAASTTTLTTPTPNTVQQCQNFPDFPPSPTRSPEESPQEERAAEKLKLRLKVDKCGPFNVRYTAASTPSHSEPRVPPLHISLRGRNAAVVTRCRERKREGKPRRKIETATAPVPDIIPPISTYPTEAEVASILRSVPEVTTDDKKRKRGHGKSLTPLRPQVRSRYINQLRPLNHLKLEDKRRKMIASSNLSGKTSSLNSNSKSGQLLSQGKAVASVTTPTNSIGVIPPEKSSALSSAVVISQTTTVPSMGPSPPAVQEVQDPNPEGHFISNGRKDYQPKTSPESDKQTPPYPAKQSPGEKTQGGPGGALDKAGDDSGIESMDALSEKSPNRGDSPNRKDECKKSECKGEAVRDEDEFEEAAEDPVPIRLTPALYTYSNPEKQRESPPADVCHIKSRDECYPSARSRSDSNPLSSSGKSLLEQLLIEIPGDGLDRRAVARNMRNHRLNARSPEGVLESSEPESPVKRSRKLSESSITSHDDAPATRSSKRKCSENASELIKAYMGVDTNNLVGTPTPEGDKSKSRKGDSSEEEPEKVTSEEPIRIRTPKEEEKYRTGGRRSVRQEVKRTTHKKRPKADDIVDTKMRRRASKEVK